MPNIISHPNLNINLNIINDNIPEVKSNGTDFINYVYDLFVSEQILNDSIFTINGTAYTYAPNYTYTLQQELNYTTQTGIMAGIVYQYFALFYYGANSDFLFSGDNGSFASQYGSMSNNNFFVVIETNLGIQPLWFFDTQNFGGSNGFIDRDSAHYFYRINNAGGPSDILIDNAMPIFFNDFIGTTNGIGFFPSTGNSGLGVYFDDLQNYVPEYNYTVYIINQFYSPASNVASNIYNFLHNYNPNGMSYQVVVSSRFTSEPSSWYPLNPPPIKLFP